MLLSDLSNAVDTLCDASAVTIAGYRHRIAFVQRYAGDVKLQAIDFAAVRERALGNGKSPCTIENSIKQTVQMMRRAGVEAETGTPLKVPPPDPDVIPVSRLDRTMPHMPPWLRAHCALGYVTGLRRTDLMQLDPGSIGESLTVQASKTGKVHRFPIPAWCRRVLGNVRFPRDSHTYYRAFRAACTAASVPYFSSQDLRRLAANTWESVQPGLGPLVLGHALPGWSAATPFYLRPHDALFRRIDDFPPLPSLLTDEERDRRNAIRVQLDRVIESIPPHKIETLLQVAQGLAG